MKQKQYETETSGKEKERKGFRRGIVATVIILIIILCCLFLRSCGNARDKPASTTDRAYEDDVHRSTVDLVPSGENKRLNLAISDQYVLTEEEPVFYIGYPAENQYDVVFTFLSADRETLYQTKYIAPGTNVAIDGSTFLEKGVQTMDCQVSIYDHESGALISDCVTVVLNLNYQ